MAIVSLVAVATVIGLVAVRGSIEERVEARGLRPPQFARGWHGTTVLDGLDQPRGLAWTPSGDMCIAEAGHLEGVAVERRGRLGEGASTGRVTCRTAAGARTVVAEGLPHTRLPFESGATVGAAALALRPGDRRLYLAVGAGFHAPAGAIVALPLPGRGVAVPAAPALVADLDPLFRAAADAGPDLPDPTDLRVANPYAMVAGPDGALYVTDGAANALARVWPDASLPAPGAPEYVARFPNVVPTGLARGPDGAWYVALFGALPHQRGEGSVARVAEDGTWRLVAMQLTLPIGVAFDAGRAVYVLEFAARYLPRRDRFAPESGRLLRAATLDEATQGRWQTIARRLDFPTAVTTGPDGALYLSLSGAYRGRGTGRVLRLARA